MSVAELTKELEKLDENQLQKAEDFIKSLVNKSENFHRFSELQKRALEVSLRDSHEGRTRPQDEMMKEIDEWLEK